MRRFEKNSVTFEFSSQSPSFIDGCKLKTRDAPDPVTIQNTLHRLVTPKMQHVKNTTVIYTLNKSI